MIKKETKALIIVLICFCAFVAGFAKLAFWSAETPPDEMQAKLAACTEQNNVLLDYMEDLKGLNSANPPLFDLANKQIACRDTIMIYINFLSDLWKYLDSISINDQIKANSRLPLSPYELGIYVGRFKAFSGIMDTIQVFLAPRIN